jgi:hypothetical protein
VLEFDLIVLDISMPGMTDSRSRDSFTSGAIRPRLYSSRFMRMRRSMAANS